MNERIIFFICVIINVVTSYVQGRLTDVIQTDKGKLQGEIVGTIQNESIKYSSFRGIPFAKPPIGELRFQPPVEPDAWSHVLNATSDVSLCPQLMDQYDGDEDCLYLNVYSPKTSFDKNDNESLAVMVWIHGGSFTGGSKYQSVHGPDFLIADNVLVVSINYRLGALGFLSLDTDGATGNMGLKDQVLALKWVQKNIKNFGGDPNKVTLFGLSAGSVCVLLHQLSPASKGLFRGAIGMSGSPLSRWGFSPVSLAVKQAFEIGKYLGINNSNKTQLLNRLREVSPKQLVEAVDKLNYDNSEITSDLHFNIGIDSLQKYLTADSKIPIYYYRNSFDYPESIHRQRGINFNGCAHADDGAHIFWQPVYYQPWDPNSRIGIHRTKMGRLWTNFAKYLNPTPNDPADHLLNFTWTPSGLEGLRLEIRNEQTKIEPRITTDIMQAVQTSDNPFEHANCIN
ncbi:hypothetical protein HCN44_005262 [Aphidius gifuensis]|uniref:Carboxylic ester hydrolase n=1 Tax=Aphidius gifuensis TaxID=684658 RepID=A0A834Y2T8_APHGI|nr:hypothetical protein HCN44_005262 [Aphidius gifuensis]